jgi:hypothetical protein
MQFHTDDYFHIGYQHVSDSKPCQDYAISGVLPDAAFAIVSDGCSTGGLTDVGARFVSLSMAQAIREHWRVSRDATESSTPDQVNLEQRIILGGARKTFGLSVSDMLATCAYAYLSQEGGFVHIRGDGVIALVGVEGGVTLHRFDWAGNMPFYPAYADDGYAVFIDAHGGDVRAKLLTEQVSYLFGGEEAQAPSVITHSLGAGIKGITIPLHESELKQLSFIAILSDGVTQVDSIEWKKAAKDLLAFKSIEGKFAKRRMRSFIQNVQKTGKGPVDDISFAVIRIAQDTESKKES